MSRTPRCASRPGCGAGKNQNNISFNYDLVNYSSNKTFEKDDDDGLETIEVLKTLKKLLQLLNSNDACSLGLHPIIYFYSKRGNFKPAMFYATILFVKKLNEHKKFKLFIANRAKLESFLYKYDFLFDQINRNLRSSKKSAIVISDIIFDVIKSFDNGQNELEIMTALQQKYNILVDKATNDTSAGKRSDLKSSTFIAASIPNLLKCKICGGAIHSNSISLDHIIRKRDDGKDDLDNVQLTHPYCNTGYKN